MSASVLAGSLTPNHIGKQVHIAVEGVGHEGELSNIGFKSEYKFREGHRLIVDLTLTHPGPAWTFLHVPVNHVVELAEGD